MAGYAYGITTDTWKMKDNAYEILYKMIKKHPKSHLRQMITDYYLTNKESDEYGEEAESFFDFTEWYENEQLNSGIEAVITDLINDLEFNSKYIFEYDNWAIYVRPYIPKDDDYKDKYPSQEKIRQILNKYINPILKAPQAVDWIIIDLD